jgi:hypothetical protein
MGASYHPGATRAEIVAYVTRPEFFVNGVKTVATKQQGNNLWVVNEQANGNRTLMVVELIGSDTYKAVGEEMGPWQTTCPLAFFDLVPNSPNEDAKRFRERCRAQQAASI